MFSSFAYLLGSLRAVSDAIATALDAEESSISMHLFESVAIATEGWSLLLPEPKKSHHLKDGEIDELMFQAHMTVHA